MKRARVLGRVALLAACASTSIQNEWRAQDDTGRRCARWMPFPAIPPSSPPIPSPPTMTATYDVATLETRVFRSATEKLVWVGGTETFAPSSNVRMESEALSKLVIEALAKAKLL